MKRTALTLIVAILLLAVAETVKVNLARAQVPSTTISIESPSSSIFYGHKVPLTFEVYEPVNPETDPISRSYWVTRVSYIIDDNQSVDIMRHDWGGGYYTPIQNTSYLYDVPDGQHKIQLTGEGYYAGVIGVHGYNFSSTSVYFTVDTSVPKITIQSVQNETYYATEMPLTFTVNEQVSLLNYSIDGAANVTTSGNTTLPKLAYGSHKLTLYVSDVAGNLAYETVYFTIEPFPTFLVVAVSVAVAVVVATGLLVYFKKHKHKDISSSATSVNN
jgi:hypothetical protein